MRRAARSMAGTISLTKGTSTVRAAAGFSAASRIRSVSWQPAPDTGNQEQPVSAHARTLSRGGVCAKAGTCRTVAEQQCELARRQTHVRQVFCVSSLLIRQTVKSVASLTGVLRQGCLGCSASLSRAMDISSIRICALCTLDAQMPHLCHRRCPRPCQASPHCPAARQPCQPGPVAYGRATLIWSRFVQSAAADMH